MSDIPEADWKVLRSLKDVALERLCDRILAEIQAAATMPGRTSHQRYLDVWLVRGESSMAVSSSPMSIR